MHKWPVATGLVRVRPRAGDFCVSAVRQFHNSPPCAAEGEDRRASQSTPIRSRSATASANVWNQVRDLPSRSSSASRGQVSFDDAVKAAGGRSLAGSVSGDRPRGSLVRFTSQPGGSIPQGAAQGQGGPRIIRRTVRGGRGGSGPGEGRRDLDSGEGRGGFVQRGGGRGGMREGRGRGRGRGVGGRGRGGRGGGRGGLRRRPFVTDADDEDEGDEDDEAEYENYYNVLTSDDFIDNFTSLSEAESYSKLQEFVDDYEEAATVVELAAQDAAENPQEYNMSTKSERHDAKEAVLSTWDPEIAQALTSLVEADEQALPRHPPATFSASSPAQKTILGDVPIGRSGMGNVVEEGLRLLSDRSGLHWQDPKELARKLLNGDMVQFRNVPEKTEVLKHAENFGYDPSNPPAAVDEDDDEEEVAQREPNVGFEQPSESAKREIVKRLVEGKYADPDDEGITNAVLKNVARIAGGNATVTPEGKRVMLRTIAALLPAAGRGGAGAGAGARAQRGG